MPDGWTWWVSRDDEDYTPVEATTRDEAVEAGRGHYDTDSFWIIEAVLGTFNWHALDGYWLLERLEESNQELGGDEPMLDYTDEQRRDLERMVGDAMAAWAAKHGIKPRVWAFAKSRNREKIPALPPVLPPPLPFARPRAVEGGPACPATAEARFDALLMELTGDEPATLPTPAEAGK